MICNICTERTKSIYFLGHVPPINIFQRKDEARNSPPGCYPLGLDFCEKCSMVQLPYILSPSVSFSEYQFITSASESSIRHMENVAKTVAEKANITDKSKVLEIGSNDGTLLSKMLPYTTHLLGIDPAENLKPLAAEKGISQLANFFNKELAADISLLFGIRYDLILALNVVAHTPKVLDLLEGVQMLLKENGGMFIVEAPYVRDTVLQGSFDTVYHEHVYHFSVTSMTKLLEKVNLELFDVEEIDVQGGSLRFYISHPGDYQKTEKLLKLQEYENSEQYSSFSCYNQLRRKFESYKKDIQHKLKEKKKKIIGVGAPARGMVIVNTCEIKDYISQIIDDTPLKQGRLAPGTKIPVTGWDELPTDEDVCFLLLSWNYKDHLLEKIKKHYPRKEIEVILPFPRLKEIKI